MIRDIRFNLIGGEKEGKMEEMKNHIVTENKCRNENMKHRVKKDRVEMTF